VSGRELPDGFSFDDFLQALDALDAAASIFVPPGELGRARRVLGIVP
jgi:hypothetical protein